MALDGIVIANITRDMKEKLEGGKINKKIGRAHV